MTNRKTGPRVEHIKVEKKFTKLRDKLSQQRRDLPLGMGREGAR